MGSRVDNQARALLDRIVEGATRLRSDCGSFFWIGDEDSCANKADAIDYFVNVRAPRLLERSEDGDDGAHNNIVEFCQLTLADLHTAFSDISSGLTFSDVAGEVAADIKKKGEKLVSATPYLVAAAVVIAVALAVARR